MDRGGKERGNERKRKREEWREGGGGSRDVNGHRRAGRALKDSGSMLSEEEKKEEREREMGEGKKRRGAAAEGLQLATIAIEQRKHRLQLCRHETGAITLVS